MPTTEIQTTTPNIPKDKYEQIVKMLVSGEFPIDAEIARAVDIPVKTIRELLKSDPKLAEMRRDSQIEMAQLIEQSAVNLATGGRNEIARQKAQEFMLKHLMPEKYGEDAEINRSAQSLKRVLLIKQLPVVEVDENGIPIAKSKSPLEPAMIEAK